MKNKNLETEMCSVFNLTVKVTIVFRKLLKWKSLRKV